MARNGRPVDCARPDAQICHGHFRRALRPLPVCGRRAELPAPELCGRIGLDGAQRRGPKMRGIVVPRTPGQQRGSHPGQQLCAGRCHPRRACRQPAPANRLQPIPQRRLLRRQEAVRHGGRRERLRPGPREAAGSVGDAGCHRKSMADTSDATARPGATAGLAPSLRSPATANPAWLGRLCGFGTITTSLRRPISEGRG